MRSELTRERRIRGESFRTGCISPVQSSPVNPVQPPPRLFMGCAVSEASLKQPFSASFRKVIVL